MSITTFPSADGARGPDSYHLFATGAFVAVGTDSTFTGMNATSLTSVIDSGPYSNKPWLGFRNSDTDWGVQCLRAGYYHIDWQFIDLTASTLAVPPSGVQDYSMGLNGAENTTNFSTYAVKFLNEDEYHGMTFHGCGRFNVGDVLKPGTKFDTGTDVFAAARMDFQAVRVAE